MKKLLPFLLLLMPLPEVLAFTYEFPEIDSLKNKTVHQAGCSAGGATVFSDRFSSIMLEANYEYKKYGSNFGFGFASQFITGEYTEYLFNFPVYWHNISPLNFKLIFAPGIVLTKRIKYSEPSAAAEAPTTNTRYSGNFFLRIGLGWETYILSSDVPLLTITPNINLNIVSEYKVFFIYGCTLTWCFY